MIESFVDLTYRGLSLARRVKLTLVRPSNGYLEMPTPMPVGSRIALTTDEGVIVDAVVAEIREQTTGNERPPGMKIVPALGPEVAASWWKARVALTEEAPAPPRVIVPPTTPPPIAPVAPAAPAPAAEHRSVIVRPRPNTLVEDVPEAIDDVPNGLMTGEVSDEADEPEIRISDLSIPVAVEPQTEATNSKRTVVMAAVDQELLKQLTETPGEIEKLVERTGDHPVIDDGKRTIVMAAVDPSVLGLDSASSSGSLPQSTDDDSKPGGRKRRTKKR